MAKAKKKPTVKKRVIKNPTKKVTKKSIKKRVAKTVKKAVKKDKAIKCKLKQCLNCEDGICSTGVPLIEKMVIPSSIKCKFFDDDFDKTYNEFKKAGGVLGIVLRGKGKLTEEEAKEEKKAMRKAKADAKKRKKEK